MPAHFFDTCALVYRYLPARATGPVEALLAAAGPHFISRLGVTEFHSAFAKLVRSGKLTAADYDLTVQALRSDVAGGLLRVMPVKNPRHGDAERLIRDIGLRSELSSQDAVQLSVALHLRSVYTDLTIVTCDQALLAAAAVVQLPSICP